MQSLLGVDTGGTFTDFVLLRDGEIQIHKVLSTPDAPERAILQGIDELGLAAEVAASRVTIIHGSTVATNAALEGKGVRTALITNKGFADLLSIGRQTRRELYNLQPEPIEPPVPAELCLEVNCRTDAEGRALIRLEARDIERLIEQLRALKPQAVAINLLFSFLDPSDEKSLEQALNRAFTGELFVTRSSFVLPEYKEYERGIATWLNAYLGPRVASYLQRLQAGVAPAPLGVMQSSGGTIDAAQAAQRAVNLLLSGPAGGLAAANHIARLIDADKPQLLTFDMGGTSTDVALIEGELRLTTEGKLGHYPVAVPMVDMHTIGAGGGSIASVDAGGLLCVGPESAGAAPGPACYGQGGSRATVTDANAVLGRLRPDNFLGGAMALDLASAERAIDTIAEQLNLDRIETALGVIAVANEHMARALRTVSVQRGYDPADYRLCCFGGAGGLHVCALAEALSMRAALVPVHGGVLSALGMLAAPRERQLSNTHQQRLDQCGDAELQVELQRLAHAGTEQLQREGVERTEVHCQPSLDVRYLGQSYTLNIDYHTTEQVARDFHQLHRQRFGHQLDIPLELVNLRQRVFARTDTLTLPPLAPRRSAEPVQHIELPELGQSAIYQRSELAPGQKIQGPALICERVSTTLIAPNWLAVVDRYGNLLLQRAPT